MSNSTSTKKRKLGQCTSTNVDHIALRFCGMPTSDQIEALKLGYLWPSSSQEASHMAPHVL